jgi:hypothetical protein
MIELTHGPPLGVAAGLVSRVWPFPSSIASRRGTPHRPLGMIRASLAVAAPSPHLVEGPLGMFSAGLDTLRPSPDAPPDTLLHDEPDSAHGHQDGDVQQQLHEGAARLAPVLERT